jgi:hypothetical protein
MQSSLRDVEGDNMLCSPCDVEGGNIGLAY